MLHAADITLQVSQGLLAFCSAYLLVGAFVAFAFITFGLEGVDAAAREAYGFRILIYPGLVLLWPLVVWRWWSIVNGASDKPRPVAHHVRLHAFAWIFLLVMISSLLGIALFQSHAVISKPANSRLEKPQ